MGSRMRTARAFATSATNGNGNGNGNNGKGKNFWEALVPTIGGATLIKLAMDKVMKHARYGFQKAYPRFKDAPHGELSWEVPAEGLEEKDVRKMVIDRDNVFVFKGETDDGLPRSDSFQLPTDANFEKAKIKAWMKNGMINVTATGFEKEEVPITFD